MIGILIVRKVLKFLFIFQTLALFEVGVVWATNKTSVNLACKKDPKACESKELCETAAYLEIHKHSGAKQILWRMDAAQKHVLEAMSRELDCKTLLSGSTQSRLKAIPKKISKPADLSAVTSQTNQLQAIESNDNKKKVRDEENKKPSQQLYNSTGKINGSIYTIKNSLFKKVAHKINADQRVIITGDFDKDGRQELIGLKNSRKYSEYVWSPKIRETKKNDKGYWQKGLKLSKDPSWFASFITKKSFKGDDRYFSDWKISNEVKDGCVHPAQILPAHLNDDDIQDFVVVCHGYDAHPFPGEHSLIMLSKGNASFVTKKFTKNRAFYHDGVTADFNNDGHLDILLTDTSANKIRVYVNDGFGNFQKSNKYFTQFAKFRAYTAEVLDVNTDGHFDLFIAGIENAQWEPQETLVLLGNKNNKFSSKQSLKIPAVKGYGVVLDVIKEGSHLYVLRTGSKPNYYKGSVIQQVAIDSMETVATLENQNMRWLDRIFRTIDEDGRIVFGSLTPKSNNIDFVVENGIMSLAK